MKNPEYEKLDVPRICPKIKELNGKSTRKLKQCIDNLSDVLQEDHKVTKDNRPSDPST